MAQRRRNIPRSSSRDADALASRDLFSLDVRERLEKISAEQNAVIATKNSGLRQSALVQNSRIDCPPELGQHKESISDPVNIGAPTLLSKQELALPTSDAPEQRLTGSEDRDANPLPARALNEFVYCPRLFYYEFVEGIFVESADTLRGASFHRRVDTGTGAMPIAANAPKIVELNSEQGDASEAKSVPSEIIHSRSVLVGSERLGVTAKLDLVEVQPSGTDGSASLLESEVLPVDYKAGSPRQGEEGNELWPTDKMQLGLQILLLRENGYSCRSGIIYYRGTKQRVPLEMTAGLETWILEQIAAARRAAAGPIPPPLVDSPKCVRCSLNSVCLPDETRLLKELKTADLASADNTQSTNSSSAFSPIAAPRRLIAPRDEARVLYLNKPGLRVGRKEELLVVKEEKKTPEEIRIGDILHVSLFGNIQLSTQAIQVLCEKEVPITYFSMGGWFYGITRGHELKNVFTRMEQFRLARDPITCLALARRFVSGKIRNHRTMLMRLHLEPPSAIVGKLKTLAESALEAKSPAELLGTEGAAASFYFSHFAGMLKAEDEFATSTPEPGPQLRFNFAGRNRRPPTDPVNAMLSLAYSLLAKDCTLAAMSVGLDPYVGFYHQPRFGRPALALDLMEEFRPLIAESVVLTCINNRMILPRHFVQAGKAVNLSPGGRKFFFQAYEQRMNSLITHPIFDYKVSYRRVIEMQFRLLARFLTGEIPEYPPFLTR
jgi:CRISP-associated protein Cas1